MINWQDIREIEITNKEIELINEYTDKNFYKPDIDKRASQFHYEGEKRNPNATGIIGEWAIFKKYSNYTLEEYLKLRPVRRSDKGDGTNLDGVVWDVKVINWRSEPRYLWNKDNFQALVENKHLGKNFIDVFVFGFFNPIKGVFYLMGWMEREEYGRLGQWNKKGDQLSPYFKCPADCVSLKYRELRPIGLLFYKGVDIVNLT